MEPLLLAFAGWLDTTGLTGWARGELWAYPVANVLHVLGLAMFLGAIGMVDLRLAGLWRRLPLAAMNRALVPVAGAGLVVLAGSGTVLFAADATALAGSGVFRTKLLVILLALGNAALFRWKWQKRLTSGRRVLPPGPRLLALLSLLLWVSVAVLGRLIAYL